MKTLAPQWISEHVTRAGMIGCGVSEPGGQCLCQSANELVCPAKTLELILQQIGAAKTPPVTADVPTQWQTWVFAHGKIRSAMRPDGWTMIAVVNAEAVGIKTLDALAASFLALTPAG
jgi:hypothetical protein